MFVKPTSISMGNSVFVTWPQIDAMLDNWAKSYFGKHVRGEGERDDTDCYLSLLGLRDSDKEKFALLFDKYDTNHDYDPDYEFCTGEQTSLLPDCITRGVMNEVFKDVDLRSVGKVLAIEGGVFLMENELNYSEFVIGRHNSSISQQNSKSNLNSIIQTAQEKSSARNQEAIDLASLAEQYIEYYNLDEVAYYSSQELNINFIECVYDALTRGNANYVAKFLLQHLDHYVSFATQVGQSKDLQELNDLCRHVFQSHGHDLEPEVQEIYRQIVQHDFMLHANKPVEYALTPEEFKDEFGPRLEEDMPELQAPGESENKLDLYCTSIVNSEGYSDGAESRVAIYTSWQDCLDGAYAGYEQTWESLEGDGIIVDGHDSNDCPMLSKDDFEDHLRRYGNACIQLDQYHIQFEFFKKEIQLPKEYTVAQKPGEKRHLTDQLRSASQRAGRAGLESESVKTHSEPEM